MDSARKLITALLLFAIPALAGQKHVTLTGAGSHNGTSLANAWTMAEANANQSVNDTLWLYTGNFGTPIAPTQSHVSYLAYPGAACSLYTSTSPIVISSVDYVIVRGVAAQINPTSDNIPVLLSHTLHSAVLDCRIYGGTTNDLSGRGAFYVVLVSRSSYCRIIGNYVDRQDPNLDNDGSWLKEDRRGDGIGISAEDPDTYTPTNDAMYNIIEGNTVVNVSHYAIDANYGTGLTPAMNITRNNTIRDVHVGVGTINQNVLTLVEGNRVYSIGQKNQHRGGVGWEGTGIRIINRFNMFANDSIAPTNGSLYSSNSTGTQASFAIDSANRYYGNAFLGLSRNDYEWHAFSSERPDGLSGNIQFGHSVFVNNIFGPTITSHGSLPYYWKDAQNVGAARDTLRYNLFVVANPAGDIVTYDHGGVYHYTVSTAHAAEPTFETTNLAGSALWLDSTSIRGARSFALDPTSRCVDAGGRLTSTAASAASGQKVIQVGDAYYFHYDWGASPYDRGDSLLIGSQRIELDSVDYANNRLIAKSNLSATIAAGVPVHVLATWRAQSASYVNRLSGSAPDIGPYEYSGSSGIIPPGPTTNVSPTNGSTQLQPITFRWRAVSGATRYWFCLTTDGWGTLAVSRFDLTDTLITMSGLPSNTSCSWNVAAGNDAGWSYFSGDWTVVTDVPAVPSQTIKFDWINQVVNETVTANAEVDVVNLQRISNILVLRNPGGHTVTWDPAIDWPGLASPPQPVMGAVSVYFFVREGSTAHGIDLTNVGTGSGVSSAWVLQQLAQYLRNDANARIAGGGDNLSITLYTANGPDSAIVKITGGLLTFWDSATGWKTLSELAAGGGGSGDITSVNVAGGVLSGGGTTGDVTITLDSTKLAPFDSLHFAQADSNANIIVPHKGKLYIGSKASAAGDITGVAAGMGLSGGGVSGDVALSVDTTVVMSKVYANDYLPLTGGSLSGSLDVTGSTTSSTFAKSTTDSIGSTSVAGNRYTYWQNTNGQLRIGIGVTGTVSIRRYWPDGGSQDIYNSTKATLKNSWWGYHEYDSVNVVKLLTVGAVGSEKRVMSSTDSANARVYSDSRYKLKTSADSASIVLAMAGTSWLATTNTDSTSGPILFPKYFVIDSVMIALAGTASTDTVKVDVRYGPDYSATGTAVVTTPGQIAASGLWTRTVPNSATVPAFNNVWVKMTKKVGTPKRLTVMLKGRWQ